MTSTIAYPRGISLPYSSLFNISLRNESKSLGKSRPADYFWNEPARDSLSNISLQTNASQSSNDNWLSSGEPAFSDSEDESPPEQQEVKRKAKRIPRMTRLRQIAFTAFSPKLDQTSHKKNIVTSTEIISRREILNDFAHHSSNIQSKFSKRILILNSWKVKSKANSKTQVHKMAAVLKDRINASSPFEKQPKTWEEYDHCYGEGKIDVYIPPLPPMDPTPEAFKSRFYRAPEPSNEKVRQLVVNRLGVLGDKPFDPTDEGVARSKARLEIGNKLLEEGRVPALLEEAWECSDSTTRNSSTINVDDTAPPETLEQHPVLRKIVKQCRGYFGTALSVISLFDDKRQVFLAESGLDGMREISRDISFCAHTLLSGRKGFMILDTHKDWRFENGPLVQNLGSRFYAGVPLMAPNLDGSEEAEINACPIGALCIVDMKPRESFSVEDCQKLVDISEYARKEIAKWFAKKMRYKMDHLRASREIWNREKQMASDEDPSIESNILSNGTVASTNHSSPSNQSGLTNIRSSGSLLTGPTSPSSHVDILIKSHTNRYTGLVEHLNAMLKPKTLKLFDLATKLVAETLGLSLVYLAAVMPDGESRTIILSGHNIPLPVPVFDTDLHLRVLRTPEGGLLYQNPSLEEFKEAGLICSSNEQKNSANPYASAILLAVGTEARSRSGGFVLAGYSDDPKRVFGEEDVVYMKHFAHELSSYTSQLLL